MQALRTLVMALVWMPLYLFVLAPLIFAIVLVFSLARFLYSLLTGAPFDLKPERTIEIWDWAEDNTLALLGARGRQFRRTPP